MDDLPTVFIVDDGRTVRRSLGKLLDSMDVPFEIFPSAEEFLEAFSPSRPGCLVLEIRLPGLDGLDLLDALNDEEARPPVVFTSASTDVPTVVRAMKAGAFDFLEKPLDPAATRRVLRAALRHDADNRKRERRKTAIRRRIGRLTAGERDVLRLLIDGKSNKAMAARLGLSVRAIEVRRAKVMRKMQARSLAELVRWVQSIGERLGRPRTVAGRVL